jgi:hypothetical protein
MDVLAKTNQLEKNAPVSFYCSTDNDFCQERGGFWEGGVVKLS